MDLEEFFEKNDITKADFCKKLSVSYGYFHQILKKKLTPSKKIARRIEEASDKQVLIKDLISPLDGGYQKLHDGSIKDLYNKIEEIEKILAYMIPRSQFTSYHLDFLQQMMERDRNETKLSNVLKSYKERLNELIEEREIEEQV